MNLPLKFKEQINQQNPSCRSHVCKHQYRQLTETQLKKRLNKRRFILLINRPPLKINAGRYGWYGVYTRAIRRNELSTRGKSEKSIKSSGEKIYIANGVYGRHDILMLLIFLCVAVIQ